jgi:hypothetical protein
LICTDVPTVPQLAARLNAVQFPPEPGASSERCDRLDWHGIAPTIFVVWFGKFVAAEHG